MAPERLPSLVWLAPVLNPGGYSSEALSFAAGAGALYARAGAPFGLRQFAEQQDADFARGLPEGTLELLRGLFRAGAERRAWDVAVCHATPDVWHEDGAFGWGRAQPCPPPGARFHVGRTMYETDRLPEAWVPRINAMHEVWVPSRFAVEQFAGSGVERSKLVVVPEAVDSELFDPARHRPLDLGAAAPPVPEGGEGLFRFLSVFKFERRKGWDVLLGAYFEEFSAADPVALLVKTQAFHSGGDLAGRLRRFADGLATARRPLARYSVLAEDLPLAELPRLYRAADAFVLPSRGEGWGRPHVEAMAMALPVIATNWSGSTEFLAEDCSLPLRIDGLVAAEDGPPGHRWAQPSAAHLRELMRWASEHRAEARAIGARAREAMVARFSPEAVAREHLLPRLRGIARRLAAREDL